MAIRIPFRTVQLGTMAVVLLTTFVVVGVTSFVAARGAVQDLSLQVLLQTSERIDLRVRQVVDMAVSEGRIVEGLMDAGDLPPDRIAMQRYFLEVMQAEPRLSYLSYSTETGEYWHVVRNPGGQIGFQDRVFDPAGRRVLRDWVLRDDGGQDLVFTDPDSSFDPRPRPYYVLARQAGHAVWTDTYVFLNVSGRPEITGVTRTVPILREGALAGVVTVDIDLLALSRYLSAVPVGSTGFAFLLEHRADGTRRVIAHPDPTRLLAVEGGVVEAIPAAEFDDPLVRAFAEQVPADLSEVGGAIVPVRLEIEGEDWFGAYKAVTGIDPPPWILCAALPVSDVMGRVEAMTRTTALVAGMGLLLSGLLGLTIARVLTGTVTELEEEMHRVARFELSPRRLSEQLTRIAELDDMRLATDAMKEGLRSFGRYVPAELVREVVSSGGEARLGAARRPLTILFAEIPGFGALVEATPPDRLMEAVGEYLGQMDAAIRGTQGTAVQYLGDVIMAFWGAPAVHDDHAALACRGALAMHRCAIAFAATAAGRGLPALPTTFGLCTGEVLVGNIGAPNRFNYGALGDAVNTAARLGGLNKTYDTALLVGETTATQAGAAVITRPVDWVRMKGKALPLLVHELVGLTGEVDPDVLSRVAAYHRGLDAYRARRFEEAIEAFGALSDDGPSRVMLARCLHFREHPPGPDWDGVFTMKTK